jgi:hypothetical protein
MTKIQGFNAIVSRIQNPRSPREVFDNPGTLWAFSPLVSEHGQPNAVSLEQYNKGLNNIMSLKDVDVIGVEIPGDNGVACLFMKRETAIELYGQTSLTKRVKDLRLKELEREAADLENFLRGEVYQVQLVNAVGDVLDQTEEIYGLEEVQKHIEDAYEILGEVRWVELAPIEDAQPLVEIVSDAQPLIASVPEVVIPDSVQIEAVA